MLLKGVCKMRVIIAKPEIISFTKKEIEEYIVLSASCQVALCTQSNSFTCGTSSSYTCTYYSGEGVIGCPEKDSYTCGAAHDHVNR